MTALKTQNIIFWATTSLVALFFCLVFVSRVEASSSIQCTQAGFTPYAEYNGGTVVVDCASVGLGSGTVIDGNITTSGDGSGQSFDAAVQCSGGEAATEDFNTNQMLINCPNSSVKQFVTTPGGPIYTPDEVADTSEDAPTAVETEVQNNPIFKRLQEIISFLVVGVGIVVTISIVIAGIQYTTSRGDPNKTAAAVNRITQAGIALFLYVFGSVILNWLIPGGLGFNLLG